MIKKIIYDEEDRVFYLLANKYDQMLGFFIIRMNEENPGNGFQFLTKYKNKLDIGDCDIFVMRSKGQKELIVSYKTIFINTYNIVIMDIASEKQSTIARHESFQLWESKVKGIILQKNNDFITFSKTGINVSALGSSQKRLLHDNQNNDMMVHSLESVDFLKVDPDNFILFECADTDRVISI